jgi:hypothetical protein
MEAPQNSRWKTSSKGHGNTTTIRIRVIQTSAPAL